MSVQYKDFQGDETGSQIGISLKKRHEDDDEAGMLNGTANFIATVIVGVLVCITLILSAVSMSNQNNSMQCTWCGVYLCAHLSKMIT